MVADDDMIMMTMMMMMMMMMMMIMMIKDDDRDKKYDFEHDYIFERVWLLCISRIQAF